MQAIKGAFVTIKYTGLPDILMVFQRNKELKGFSTPVRSITFSMMVLLQANPHVWI